MMRILRHVVRWTVPLVLALLSASCATTGADRVNAWPLFYYNRDEARQTVTVSVLTPLVYFHRTEETREFALRPVFSFFRDDAEDVTVLDLVYPIGKYKQRGLDREFMLFPIIKDETHEVLDDRLRTNHDYFPLYWGTSEDGEPYGGFFPLYGTVKRRFGKDEAMFLFWPIYSMSTEDGFRSDTFMWPVVRTVTGEGGWGFRVLPLFGHEEITGVEYKTTALFPLITVRGRYLDTETPLTDVLVLPLFAYQQSPYSETISIVWPFSLVSYAYDERVNYRKYSFVWPFITFSSSDYSRSAEIAPIYRRSETREGDDVTTSMYLFYPIYKEYHFTSEDKREDTYRFFLIDKFQNITYTDGTEAYWYYLFPVYNRRLLESGVDTTKILYPLPLYDDGFLRNYLPLFEVYSQNIDEEGVRETRILHHLYIKTIRDNTEYIDAPFYYKERPLP